jgi:hypothetical protein
LNDPVRQSIGQLFPSTIAKGRENIQNKIEQQKKNERLTASRWMQADPNLSRKRDSATPFRPGGSIFY